MQFDMFEYMDACKERGIPMTQAAMAKIAGVSRYHLNKAYNNNLGVASIPEDKVYRLYIAHPFAISDFPADFTDYSCLSLLLSQQMYGISLDDASEAGGVSRYSLYSAQQKNGKYFIYDLKEAIDAAFGELYLPYIYEGGKLIRDIKEDREILIDEENPEEIPERYRTMENVLANISLRRINPRAYVKRTGYKIQCNKENSKNIYSADQNIIDEICHNMTPFYVPLKVSEAKEMGIY